jgi:hypothetical protein
MRFGLLGSIVQIGPGSEGYMLWQADLIDKGGEDWEVEIQPTVLLRSLFTSMPEMEVLYPVLVEFVLIYNYPVVSTINHTTNELTYPIESGGSWTEPARWEQPIRPRTQEIRHDARYAALVSLARPARSLRLGLLSARIPPLRRVDHRHGPQRRRAHGHSVRLGLGATCPANDCLSGVALGEIALSSPLAPCGGILSPLSRFPSHQGRGQRRVAAGRKPRRPCP